MAQVIPMGGGRKQYQVQVDPTALHEYGVTLRDVEDALRANNVNATGGYTVREGMERPVRVIGRLGPRSDQVVQDLRSIPVKVSDRRTVILDQVARVVEGSQPKRGDASVNGAPGIVLTIVKQLQADTREVTEAVNTILGELDKSLPADVAVETDLYELRAFIDRGVSNVGEALAIGAVLVLVVLFLFLLNVRTTLISLTTILSYYLLSNSTAIHRDRDGFMLRGLKWLAGHVFRLAEPYRADVANLGELRLALPNGRGQVRLRDLADITPPVGGDTGANQIKRDNARRRLVVRVNVADRDLAGVAADVRRTVEDQVKLPEGYYVEYGGQFECHRRAARLIALLSIVSGIGMFFVLFTLFPSVRVVLQILHAVPVAFVGGVFALVLTGQTLTVASLVGFISLGGIAVRNGILLVTHYRHLMRFEGEQFTERMIVRGSLERLSPVLMTALTAGIALVPLVVAGQQPGREVLYPVATVILGGLVTSTLCEFLLHPGLFWRFSGKGAAGVAASAAEESLDNDRPVSLQPAPL